MVKSSLGASSGSVPPVAAPQGRPSAGFTLLGPPEQSQGADWSAGWALAARLGPKEAFGALKTRSNSSSQSSTAEGPGASWVHGLWLCIMVVWIRWIAPWWILMSGLRAEVGSGEQVGLNWEAQPQFCDRRHQQQLNVQ